MTDLPSALEPLQENRRELTAILDLLDDERDPTARADIAGELVGSCARYEDVKDRVIYPALRTMAADSAEIDRAEADQQAIRDALGAIRHRTQNIRPSDVHATDPEGFEQVLDGLVEEIRVHLEHEVRTLFPMLDGLAGGPLDALREDVERAVGHASSHPDPPSNAVGRAIVGAVARG
jgi:hypothetical protein